MIKRILCLILALVLSLSWVSFGAEVTEEEEIEEIEEIEENVGETVVPDEEASDTGDEESADVSLDENLSVDEKEEDEKKTESDKKESVVTGEYLLLKELNILTTEECETFFSNTRISRGKFMKLLTKLSGLSEAVSEEYKGSFRDVDSSTPDYMYIGIMEDIRIISGDGTGRFHPEDNISFNQAVTTVVKLLGYDVYATADYPAGYLSAANISGISKGIGPDREGYISGENILRLLMNALTVEVILQESYGNDKLEISEGESYLEAVFGVREETGIITANEYTGISDELSAVAEGCVLINETVFSAPLMDTAAELGKKITFYAVYDKYGNGLPEIIWYDYHKSCKTITLDAREIISVSDYSVSYMKTETKEVKLKFAGDSNLVYNFRAFPEYTYEHLDIKMGTVTMVDNDNDGIHEFINVISYSEIFVESVSTDDEIIYGSRDEKILLPKGEGAYKVYNADEETDLSSVYPGTVVNIIASSHNDFMVIYIGVSPVTGTVNGVREDENTTYVTVDETEYLLSALATYVPAVGDYGTYYLNCKGEISLKDKIVTNEKYAYLMKIKTVGTVEKVHYFKLLTTTGIEVYEAAEKIKLNDNPLKTADAVIGDDALYANGAEDSEGNKTEQQLIIFKTDKNGKLDLIKTYSDYYNSYVVNNPYYKKDKNDTTFTLDYQSGAAGYLTFYAGPTNVFGTKYLTDADTEIFLVPSTPNEDEEDYQAGKITKLSTQTKYYNIEIYNLSENYMTGAAVIRNSNSDVSITNSNANMVISKITKFYNEDSAAEELKIYGYVRGAEKMYLVDDMELTDNNASYGNGLGIKDLKPGDVIQVALDAEGYIAALRVLHCYNPETFTYRESSTSLATLYTALHTAIGKLLYRDEKTAIFNFTPPDSKTGLHNVARDRAFNFTNRTFFYKVDTKTGKLRKVKSADIPEGSMVYVRSGYCYLNDVVYYE